MIGEFLLKNLTLGLEVKFGQELDCDFLFQDDGVDWGNIQAQHNIYNYPGQVGDTISSTIIKNRDISIEAYAYYIPTDDEKALYGREELEQYAYEKIKEKKKKLNDIINPDHYVRLTIGNYYIQGKPSATPQYAVGFENNNIYFCKFLINIFCDNPMFKKITDAITVLSGDVGVFHFPLIFEGDVGYVMGTRTGYLILLVENEGNATIGGKIYLRAKGVIQNPMVENVITGEKIKINKTLQNGETVIINTIDGDDKGVWGIYQGIEQNYLAYWDFDNDWLKFSAGSTIIGYSTENQSEDLLDVSIELNPEKFGLEEM